jgi:Ni/Co efflux regulator RcnB
MFVSASTEEDIMKKFGYVIAALGAIAIAAPSIASAETVMARHGDHHRGAHAEFREHRDHGSHEGMHRHHSDRMVIGKHRHHEG